jgi:hypothetical protein
MRTQKFNTNIAKFHETIPYALNYNLIFADTFYIIIFQTCSGGSIKICWIQTQDVLKCQLLFIVSES